MKKHFLFLLLFAATKAFSQNVQLTLNVKTDKGETPEFANLIVKNAKDSSFVMGATLNEKGVQKLSLKANQSYFISISKIGLEPYNQSVTTENKDFSLEIFLKNASTTLSEVVVTQKEKLIKQDDDRTVVDAEQLAKLASNAFELLEKVPGIIVVDDNVYLGKTEAARIYINGREMKLGGSDLASVLKSMPPNSVAKIEIMRTPSAKFDASSSGGIINIVLEKGVRLGTNGSLNSNFAQGVYSKYTGGFTINHGDEKQNLYFNYQYSNRGNYDKLSSDRFFQGDATHLLQDAYTKTPAKTHYVATGFDRTISPTFNIANDLILNYDKSKANSENTSMLRAIADEKVFSENKSLINSTLQKFNLNETLSASKKLDTIGSEWNSALNYVFSSGATAQDYNNTILPQKLSILGNGDINSQRNIGSLTSDLTKKFANKFKLETGIKLDLLSNAANSAFFINKNADNSKSTNYTYNENINAAYFQMSKPIYGITIKTGIRAENTNMLGKQTIPNDTSFSVRRTDFFPYLYLSRKLFTLFKNFDLTGNLIVRRSITRPNYTMLNPAVQFIDPFFVQTGNPALRPQFTNTYEFNISFNDYPVLSFSKDETKDVFGKVTYQDPKTKIFTETYDNLGKLTEYYARLVGGLPPGGKYFGIVGVMYNYRIYKGLYQNQLLDFCRGSWSIFTYHELKFNKTTFMSVNGFLRIKGVQNFYEIKNFGGLDVNFNKKFPKQKVQLILAFNDIFHTQRPDFTLQQGGIFATGERENDTQKVGLTVRYNFGVENANKKKKSEGNIFDMVNPKQ